MNLLPSSARFVREYVESWNYDSITEVVGEALRLLELRSKNEEVRLSVLHAEVQEEFDAYEARHYVSIEPREEREKYFEIWRRKPREQDGVAGPPD